MDFRRLILTLRQQIWLLLGLSLFFLSLFLLIPRVGKKVIYASTAKILLTPAQTTAFSGEAGRGLDPGNWLADQQTLTELVSSERLLSRICVACNLRGSWQDLKERVRLEPISYDYSHRVSMFALSFQDEDPKRAQKMTEAAVQEFVSYVEELSAREFASTRKFLEELVAEAREKVSDTEEKLVAITSAHSDLAETNAATQTLATLDAEKRKLLDEQAALEVDLESVQHFLSGGTAIFPASLTQRSDGGLSSLESSVSTTRFKLMELEQLYTAENLQVREQRARLNKLQSLYDQRAQDYANSISTEKSRLLSEKKRQLQAIETKMSELRNQQLSPLEKRQVAKLERQLNMWEENHLALVKQLYQARVVEQSSRRQGAITVLENPGRAIEYVEKRGRSLGAQIALGLPFSLGVAVALIFSAELIGATLRLVPRIESTLNVSVLAVIPPIEGPMADLWEAYKREETLPEGMPTLLLERPDGELKKET